MKTATITEVKNGLSAIIDRVRAGETVVVTDRGLPVARIEPVRMGADSSARLRRLERAGIVRAGTGPLSLDLLRTPGPRPADGASAVAAVLDERRSSR